MNKAGSSTKRFGNKHPATKIIDVIELNRNGRSEYFSMDGVNVSTQS